MRRMIDSARLDSENFYEMYMVCIILDDITLTLNLQIFSISESISQSCKSLCYYMQLYPSYAYLHMRFILCEIIHIIKNAR